MSRDGPDYKPQTNNSSGIPGISIQCKRNHDSPLVKYADPSSAPYGRVQASVGKNNKRTSFHWSPTGRTYQQALELALAKRAEWIKKIYGEQWVTEGDTDEAGQVEPSDPAAPTVASSPTSTK